MCRRGGYYDFTRSRNVSIITKSRSFTFHFDYGDVRGGWLIEKSENLIVHEKVATKL